MIKNPQKETRPPFSTGVTNIGEPRKKNQKTKQKEEIIILSHCTFDISFKKERKLNQNKNTPNSRRINSYVVISYFENNIITTRIRTSIFLCLATPSISK